jgi:hypothetical protein
LRDGLERRRSRLLLDRPRHPARCLPFDDGERREHQDGRDGERDPHAGGHRFRRCLRDAGRRRCQREHSTHDRCTGDEAEVARQIQHAGNHAPLLRANIRHDGGIVGRLEQRVAGGHEDEAGDVAANPEGRGDHRQNGRAERKARQCDERHALCAKTVHDAAGRYAGQRRDDRTDGYDDADEGRLETESARQIERSDHLRRHDDCRDEQVRGEARTQCRIAEHREPDQRRARARLRHDEKRCT